MGFFSSPKGISKYNWERGIKSKLYSELDLNRDQWTMIDGFFQPYFYSKSDTGRGLTSAEVDNQISWIRENIDDYPCNPFSDKDIDMLEKVLNEFKRN